MSISEFLADLVAALKAKGMDVVGCDCIKNNGVELSGITFRDNDRIAPIMYINRYYELFKNGEASFSDVLERIVLEYKRLPVPATPDIEGMLSSPEIVDRIKLRIVNADKNKAMIAEKQLINCKIQETDLVGIFYITVFLDEAGQGSIAVSKELFDRYLTSIAADPDELYEIVTSGTQEEDILFEPVEDIIEKLSKNSLLAPIPIPDDSRGYLYVMTNKEMIYGSSVILTQAGAKKILEAFPEGKVTVVPSSVNELLIIKTTEEESVDTLKQMISEVNDSCVGAEDLLSFSLYHFDANTGKLEIAE